MPTAIASIHTVLTGPKLQLTIAVVHKNRWLEKECVSPIETLNVVQADRTPIHML